MTLTITLLGVAAIILLTAISAFFSSSELAVFSVAKHRVETLVAEKVPGSEALAGLRAEPHRFLVTALVSNNVANIAAASVATAVLVQYVTPSQAATGSTLVTSLFVIVFGEIAPKSYAVANAERHALRVAQPVTVVQRVLRPIMLVFEVLSGAVNRLTGGTSEIESYLTREEIVTIVSSGEAAGAIDAGEGAMIRGVLDLEDTQVRAVMVPRTDMVAMPAAATPDAVVETAASEYVTRIPIYGDNRDDIVGIVDVRDAITAAAAGASLDSVLEEPLFVPESKSVDALFEEMRDHGTRMVVVVNEFGAVSGIATMEDVIEEVVGEIVGRGETEHVRVHEPGTAMVRGWTTLVHLNETLELSIPTDGEFGTVAGLIASRLGRLGAVGDRIDIDDVTLSVTDATPTRIRRVRVTYPASPEAHSTEVTETGTEDTTAPDQPPDEGAESATDGRSSSDDS